MPPPPGCRNLEFRGDQCRKVYKVGRTTAKDLDEVTVNFIREYCHRWKAKSIFQVLLHYRAARRQDLVYFSQQVHLYNQSSISRLQQCRYEVPLSNVDSGRTRLDFLPKPSVTKLPFRIIDVPHIWDTSALCDPARAGDMVDDQFDWDAPLRRKDKCGRKKNTRDQEVQTGERGEPTCRRVSISHIQAPFCRNPNSGAAVGYAPSAQGPRGPKRNVVGGRPSAPDNPAPPPPVNRHRFEPSSSSGDMDSGGTLSVSERRSMFSSDERSNSYNPGPPPVIREQQRKFNGGVSGNSSDSIGDPITSPRPSLEDELSTKMKNNDTTKDTDNYFSSETDEDNNNLAKRIDALFGDVEGIAEATVPKVPFNRPVNPVYEMEMKASRGDPSNDGPPFNFQGMLRKTNYSRASLKRGQSDEFGQSNASFGGVSSYGSRDGGNRSYSNTNHTPSRNMNGPSFNSYTPSRPRRNSDKWREQDDNKVHQLAPGIVLEGEEEEL